MRKFKRFPSFNNEFSLEFIFLRNFKTGKRQMSTWNEKQIDFLEKREILLFVKNIYVLVFEMLFYFFSTIAPGFSI